MDIDITDASLDGTAVAEDLVAAPVIDPNVEDVALAGDEMVSADDAPEGGQDDEGGADKKPLTEEEALQLAYPLPEGFPTKEEQAEIVKQYGRLRTRRQGPKDAYLMRPLLRPEMEGYFKLQEAIENAPTPAARGKARLEMEEQIVSRCLVFPKLSLKDIQGTSGEFHPIQVGGTASILAIDIEILSNLLDGSEGPYEDL